MTRRTTCSRAADGRNLVATTLLCASAMLAPLAVHAQPLSGDGFLFNRPTGSLTLSGGYAQPNASTDVFTHARRNLTLGRGDFGAFSLGAVVGLRFAEQFSLQFSTSIAQRTAGSEMRDYVDQDNKPIQQTTTLKRAPFMVGLRYDLMKPGRHIGRLAYVPSRVTPYVAGGGGAMWYRFVQEGAFVDENSLDVFNDKLESSAVTGAAYGALGMDFTLRPNLALTTEARYDYAKASLNSRSFSNFNGIDLSGPSATIGLTFRY